MTEPYYQDETVTLYHGDCREVTEWLSADVLVTDPPYGMALRSGHHGDFGDLEIAGDDSLELRDYVLEAWGELRPALVFGRWSIERPAGTKTVLTWEKGNHTGMGDLNIPWSPTTEEVYVLGRWPKRESRGRNGGGARSRDDRSDGPSTRPPEWSSAPHREAAHPRHAAGRQMSTRSHRG